MENKNGQGIFYGVIGVATLVVAIIGATFAYFSASATVTGDTVTGQTLDVKNVLTLNITRINKTPETGVPSINLVPSDITSSNVGTAVDKNCAADGYTGCHLYKIDATTTQDVANANIVITNLTVTGAAQDKSSWKYIVYEGTDTTVTNVVTSGSFEITASTTPKVDIHNNAPLAKPTSPATISKTYYLVIYIANDASNSQNNADNKDVTGTYNGTITFTAAGGEVAATFSA